MEKYLMDNANTPIDGIAQEVCSDPLSFARSYQLEALDKAMKQNTIVFLETGSGKTLIAIMLLRNYAYLLRKPSQFIAVFLVPKVVLVTQQAEVVKMHTDLKVGKYWGGMGVDYWDAANWKQQQDEYEVLVMTPDILLVALRHGFLQLEMIKVLIFDECHNARGRHPYACIMTEFYHPQLNSNNSQLPKIFGMTASPVKAKGQSSESAYWQQIYELENLMHSKVYTCDSESVIAEYFPFSTPKLKSYRHMDIRSPLFQNLENDLNTLKEKHESSIGEANLSASVVESARGKISKLSSTFLFCLRELGVWLAFKAAETLCDRSEILSWGKLDVCSETIVRNFSFDAQKVFSSYIPSDPDWSIGGDMEANVADGFLSTKVTCLIESLLEYRELKDLRCIVFVERVITAIVLCTLLSELLPSLSGWKTEYTAGHDTGLQAQSRTRQNKIVEEFRKGMVNIIVATSILEEGLDVQSCNLVVRFDESATVCSFIQSRGRARMQNSDFLLLVKSGDTSTLTQVNNYLASGNIMRQETLRHASVPCQPPLDTELYGELFYRVDNTGAIVTLSSSMSLIYLYCARLPSDGYFKPYPRFDIDKELETCILYFPKNCPLPSVNVSGNIKMLKQLACLEACKQLHKLGSLTDYLVPDTVEETDVKELGCEAYVDEHENYVPPELVSQGLNDSMKSYYYYLIELERNFDYDIPLHNLVLAVRTELNLDDASVTFGLEADRGDLTVHMKYVGLINVTSEQVLLCQKFQVTIFRVLLDKNLKKLKETLDEFHLKNYAVFDYLLLPSTGSQQQPLIDWRCVRSVLFTGENLCHDHTNCLSPKGRDNIVHTKNGFVCRCNLENSLVCTPHNGNIYCISSTLSGLDGNSLFKLKGGDTITYKKYFEDRHGIDLHFEREQFLEGRHVFPVQNHFKKCIRPQQREQRNAYVELPPEVCSIIMSPISVSTFYSFSFAPSIMHRIESLLLASSLKKMHMDQCMQNDIPTVKVLEAITTQKCQEKFHLESLETLGDSFLKYAASQQLFKTYRNKHEGFLTSRKEKIISNPNLCKLGCSRKLSGFIRNEPFDPKTWIIPGDHSKALAEESLSTTIKVFTKGRRKLKIKVVADVVEALIGAFLSNCGEFAALSFMDWLGIKVDFLHVPYVRDFSVQPEQHVNISCLESLLNYTFHDASLLVEALTHGSYMLPQIPQCYQRLEFLGDSVLDYLITMHLYQKYPGISPGLITDMRSNSVNNDCYALSAIKVGLHKHILHCSQELDRDIVSTAQNFDQLSLGSTFGWESDNSFPKVLGDVIESLAGAILVDSGYNTDIVFKSIIHLLQPLVSPETVRLQPARELNELCQKEHYVRKKSVVSCDNGVTTVTVEVEANGIRHKESCSASAKKMAKKLASKAVLKSLKESMSAGKVG